MIKQVDADNGGGSAMCPDYPAGGHVGRRRLRHRPALIRSGPGAAPRLPLRAREHELARADHELARAVHVYANVGRGTAEFAAGASAVVGTRSARYREGVVESQAGAAARLERQVETATDRSRCEVLGVRARNLGAGRRRRCFERIRLHAAAKRLTTCNKPELVTARGPRARRHSPGWYRDHDPPSVCCPVYCVG